MLPRPWSLLLLVLITGCSPSLPGTLVGESAHFRLFIDPDLDPSTLAPSQQGQLGLDALETDWADKQTMLKMPAGKQKIDYHLMTGGHIAQACNVEFGATVTESGCEVVGKLEIAAGYLSDTCGASTPYVLPADFLTGAADVSVLSDPAPPQDVRYYLQLQVPFTGHVSPDGGAGVCGSCDFIQAGCALLAGDTTPVAPGLLDVAVLPSQMGSMDFDTAYGVGTVVQFSN